MARTAILENIVLGKKSDLVTIGTNRWVPDKCLWVCDNESLKRKKQYIVFPFADLYEAICHIFVGNNQINTYSCYIHLTPLTSLFRKSTDELEKILINLEGMTGSSKNWRFDVYYFKDDGREEAFRKAIKRVAGKSTRFLPVWPAKYSKYSSNPIKLVHYNNSLYYTYQSTKLMEKCRDASGMGHFNRIPINAIE